MTADKIILDLCAGTGAWSEPYRNAKGYNVRDVELEKGRDVRTLEFIKEPVHGILAAPPCTHLSGSGARWWKEKGEGALMDALSIVDACLRIVVVHRPKWWALENPVGRLTRFLGPPRMYFDPWWFGDPWTKRTALWGEFNVPRLKPVKPVGQWTGRADTKGIVDHPEYLPPDWVHKLPPSIDRAKKRSITPAGFARAFFEANP